MRIVLSKSVRRNIALTACTVPLAFLATTALAQVAPAPEPVHGGQILADVVAWGEAAFGTAIATVATAAIYRAMKWMGIQVTDGQKAQLQAVVVNGLNDAAARAQVSLKSNAALDVNVQQQVIREAVRYTQSHAADTITALGLDPNSGSAVEAIRARIATAIADPNTPTDPAITPVAAGGIVGAPAQ
jgi:Spy/CpxP family protein refolding chaperone